MEFKEIDHSQIKHELDNLERLTKLKYTEEVQSIIKTEQIKELNKELHELYEMQKDMHDILVDSGIDLDIVEKVACNIKEETKVAVDNIKVISEINKKTYVKDIGIILATGICFGGVGAIFGVIPGIVAATVGTASCTVIIKKIL